MLDQPLDNQDQTNAEVEATGVLTDARALELATEAYSASNSYFDSAIRKDLVDDLRQFQGQHPQGSKYLSEAYRGRSRFFRPKTRAAVRKNEAISAEAFFSTNDVVSVKPADDSDPQQQASAELLQALLHYRLKHSIPWFVIASGAYQDAQVQGMVCSYQAWEFDPRKKIDRPICKLIPLENIRFDPSAAWYDPVGTSPYIIELIPMYVKDVKARAVIEGDTGQAKWANVSNEELLQASTQYSDVVRLQREQGRIDPRANRSAITEFTIVWVHRNIMEIDGHDYVWHTLGTVRLLDKPRPIEEVWFHGKRPYVFGFCVVETHKSYKPGNVRLGRDVQGELNTNANQRLDNVAFAMTKRFFVKRTAQVDLASLRRNVSASATMMNDPETDVKVVETSDVTSSAYAEQDRLNLDFDDLMGAFSQASVQSNRRLNETVGGLNLLTKDASQITGYQLKTFSETWYAKVLEQLVLLEQRYEDDNIILAICAKRAQLMQRFGVSTVTDELLLESVTVDVNVGVGATNPHDQLQNFLEGMTALKEILADGVLMQYGIDVGEVIHEIFGKLGYRDGKRFFPGDEGDPRITAMLQQIQALQQQLAAKRPPEEVAATVEKLKAQAELIRSQKVKNLVESIFSAIQTSEVISAVPQVAPVGDVVLRQAGFEAPGGQPDLAGGPTNGQGLTVNPVKNVRTGMQFTPGVVPGDQNTSPGMPPKPASPQAGAMKGIETMRADSAPKGTKP